MNYISRKIGLCICAVQLIASAVFFVALWLMNLLPAKYVTIIGLVLLLFFVCVVSTQLLSKKEGNCGKSNQYFIKHWADFRILLYF